MPFFWITVINRTGISLKQFIKVQKINIAFDVKINLVLENLSEFIGFWNLSYNSVLGILEEVSWKKMEKMRWKIRLLPTVSCYSVNIWPGALC